MALLRAKSSIERNPVGLPLESVKALLPQLDVLLATYYVLFHQYQKHHWMVEGPQFLELHRFLQAHYEEVQANLDKVAERMTVLGGTPTANPVEQAKIAGIVHEPEGVFPIRESLESDRGAEAKICVLLREGVRLAETLGDYGTRELLQDSLVQAEDRAHHLDHYLGADSLEKR